MTKTFIMKIENTITCMFNFHHVFKFFHIKVINSPQTVENTF